MFASLRANGFAEGANRRGRSISFIFLHMVAVIHRLDEEVADEADHQQPAIMYMVTL